MRTRIFFVGFAVAYILLATLAAKAQTTAFTYQGRLTDGTVAANGNYDVQFRLLDTQTVGTGTQHGGTVLVPAVQVAGGIFTVQLDFGACGTCFDGSPRFVEIAVKQTSSATFTTLGPRQALTSAPYAVRSLDTAKLGGTAASEFIQTTDPRLTDARPPTAGSGSYIQNTTTQQAASNFNISGIGSAGALNTLSDFKIQGFSVLRIQGDSTFGGVFAGESTGSLGFDATFFGTAAGRANTEGKFNSFFGRWAGVNNTVGNGNTFLGANTGFANVGGSNNTLVGVGTNLANASLSNATAIGANAIAGASNSLILGSAANVGIGTTVPGSKLHLQANSTATADWQTAQLRISGAADPAMQLNLGYDTTANKSVIQSGQATVTFTDLLLNPFGGKIGIGTTAPTGTLHVRGGSPVRFIGETSTLSGSEYVDFMARNEFFNSDLGGMRIQRQPSGDIDTLIFGAAAGSGGAEMMRVRGNGNVGIGTPSPDQKLSVNGNASKIGGGSWLVFSDERLKKIDGRFTRGLTALMQLEPVRFSYVGGNVLGLDAGGSFVGFSAQTVRRSIPEAVTENSRGYLMVNNDPIMWTMLNAIKEQQVVIDQQAAKIRDQEERDKRQQDKIEQQQKQLNALTKLVCSQARHADICKEEKQDQ
jgi:hypothetical protein